MSYQARSPVNTLTAVSLLSKAKLILFSSQSDDRSKASSYWKMYKRRIRYFDDCSAVFCMDAFWICVELIFLQLLMLSLLK